ncbi:MAG: hypothetical protein ABGW95_02200, partial [Candidatus Poseidoniia archaeon]
GLSEPRDSPQRRPRRRWLRLALLLLCVPLLAEGALRAFAGLSDRERGMTWDADLGWRMLPSVEKHGPFWGVDEPARTNSHGWRDAEHERRKPAQLPELHPDLARIHLAHKPAKDRQSEEQQDNTDGLLQAGQHSRTPLRAARGDPPSAQIPTSIRSWRRFVIRSALEGATSGPASLRKATTHDVGRVGLHPRPVRAVR